MMKSWGSSGDLPLVPDGQARSVGVILAEHADADLGLLLNIGNDRRKLFGFAPTRASWSSG